MRINNKKAHHDNFVTPKLNFKQCQKIWHTKCNLDVCATKESSMCGRYFYDKKDDGLFQSWKGYIVWCNPPHSQTKKWIIKAFQEWNDHNIKIVMLIPINCMTANYFKAFALPWIEFKKEMILSRIRFLNPKSLKPSKFNSVNGYVTIFYNKRKKN